MCNAKNYLMGYLDGLADRLWIVQFFPTPTSRAERVNSEKIRPGGGEFGTPGDPPPGNSANQTDFTTFTFFALNVLKRLNNSK